MAVDKGGLQYNIKTTGEFQRLEEFRKIVRDTRAEVAKLRRSARQGIQFKGVAKEIAATAKQSKKVETLQSKIARQTGLVGKSLKEQTKATKQLLKENEKINVAIRKGRLDKEEDFKTARRVEGITRARAASERRITRLLSDRVRREQALVAARERGIELTLEEKRNLKIITAEERERLALKQRQEKLAARANNDQIKADRVKLGIAEKIAAAEERAAIRKGLADKGRAPSGELLSEIDARKTAKAAKEVNNLRDAFEKFSNSKAFVQANRISFTFRRLFGILAAFAAAREAVRQFRLLVRASVELNANLEQATLGIASLFTAVGQITDPIGQAVDATQKLVLAQQAAREQIQKLRVDALRTTATFETLVETFQVAVAPGLIAGLDIDQIRSFTVSISQAAAAIGLQQNQLAEEIRSILSGTIQARTTRIAVALGITNEDIRNAREAGVLAEFLVDRFSAFDEAGKEAFNTFSGLLNRVRDGFEIIIQQGTLEFFEDLKTSLRELFELLVTQDPLTGFLQPNPQAVEIFERFADGLTGASRSIREALQGISFEELLGFATVIGDATSSFVSLGAAIGRGLVQALSIISTQITRIKEAFDGVDFTGAISFFTTLLALTVSLQVAFSLVGVAAGSILAPLFIGVSILRSFSNTILFMVNVTKTATQGFIALRTAIATQAAATTAAAGANSVLAASFQAVAVGMLSTLATLGALTGATVSLGFAIFQLTGILDFDLSETKFGISLEKLLRDVIAFTDFAKKTAIKTLTGNDPAEERELGDAIAEVRSRIGGLKDEIEALKEAERTSIFFRDGRYIFEKRKIDNIEDAKARLSEATAELGRYEKRLAALEKGDLTPREALRLDLLDSEKIAEEAEKTAKDFKTVFIEQFKELPGEFAGSMEEGLKTFTDFLRGDLKKQMEEAIGLLLPTINEDSQSLLDIFQQMSPNIARASSTLEDMGSVAQTLRDNIEAAGDELLATQRGLGTSGGLTNILSIAQEQNTRIRENSRQFAQELQQAEIQLALVKDRVRAREEQILGLSQDRQEAVTKVSKLFEEQLKINKEIFRLEKDKTLQELIIDRQEASRSDELQNSRAELEQITTNLAKQEELLQNNIDNIKATEQSLKQQKIDYAEIGNFAAGRKQDEGILAATTQRITDLLRERARLEARVSAEIAQRIQAASLEETFQTNRGNQERALNLELARFNIQRRFAERQGTEIDRSQLLLNQAIARLNIVKQDVQIQNDKLAGLIAERQEQIRIAKENLRTTEDKRAQQDLIQQIATGENLIAQLLEQQNATRQQGNQLIEEAANEVERLAQEFEFLNAQQERPLALGLEQGFLEFANSVPSLFQATVDQLQTTLNSFAATASQTVADIFDPRKNVNIQEAFGEFLLQIGQQILQAVILQIIRQLILASSLFQAQTSQAGTSLLSAGLLWQSITPQILLAAAQLRAAAIALAGTQAFGGALASGGPVLGFDSGGTIPNRPAGMRPKGLHHTDTVPIWAAPGEFMVRARSAFAYGHDVLDKINRGLVDPMALRALAGVSSVQRVISGKPKLGYAEGGPIVAPRTAGTASGGGGGTQVLPVLVADNAAVADLLRAGEGALVEAVERAGFVRG